MFWVTPSDFKSLIAVAAAFVLEAVGEDRHYGEDGEQVATELRGQVTRG